MSQFFEVLVVEDVAAVYSGFARALETAVAVDRVLIREGRPPRNRATIIEFEGILNAFKRDLERTALRSSYSFDRAARRNLFPLRRQETRSAPGLFRVIRSRPANRGTGGLPSGAVGLADVAVLNQAVNPHTPGYGPYWRAIEYGTGSAEVPSQLGRIFRGYFYDAGPSNPTRPLAALRGVGDQPVFIPSAVQAGPRGGKGGLGRIHHEITPKAFLARAVVTTRVEWERDIQAAGAKVVSRLHAAT